MIVSAKGVHVQLGTSHILSGVDLELEAGRTLALLGANGSGKSTLVRALVGTVPISVGEIELFGVNLRRRRQIPWERIGYGPQRVTATSGVPATALETVRAGLTFGNRLRPRRGANEQAMRALETVNLGHRAHESVQTFSGGQQQRILTARALVKNPDLLILDEPFAGVDSESRAQITAVLRAQREAGTTIILVLHEVHEYAELVDEAIILEAGKVLEHTTDIENLSGSGNHNHHGQAPHYRSPNMAGLV